MALNQSNLPTTKLFRFEDFQDAPKWFGPFLQTLNLFVDPVYQLLNGGITYQNLQIPKLYTTTVTAPAAGSTTFNFVNPLRIQPTAVLLGNLYENGQPSAHPSSSVSLFWHLSQNTIYIDNITSLTPSTTYAVTLAVL